MPETSFPHVATPAQGSQQSASESVEALKSDLLTVYRAVIALEKRVNDSTVNMVEVKPQLIALKVHSESFPAALRELKRSQIATQQAVSELEARLRSLETRVKGAGAPAAV